MRTQPIASYTRVREYAERFDWEDPLTHERRVGHNPPPQALHVARHPFHILALTEDGRRMEGEVVCLKVNAQQNMRLIKFVSSGEIRWVCDLLIIEIDGVRFNAH